MLLNLTIRNFAIIDRLEVQFDEGFNVLTGETGAGKSIILDAVGLLLGDRARPDLVRAGADEATVEALFDLSGLDSVQQLFSAAGFPVNNELVLRRVVQNGGRSRAYINGSLTTLAQLQPLVEQLVTVCGQHEHQSLLQRNVHLDILDRYGSLGGLRTDYRQVYDELQAVVGQLEELQAANRNREQRLDFLQHQSDEIAAAELDVEEEKQLLAERLILQNAERLASVAQSSYDALYGESGAACEVLGRLSEELQAVSRVDQNLEAFAETLKRSLYELEDVAAELRAYLGRISYEPGRLEILEERLDLINRLKRKYAPDIAGILEMKERIDNEIDALRNAEKTLGDLERRQLELSKRTMGCGMTLSQGRKQAAQNMSAAIIAELEDLAMSGARFEISFQERERPGANGLDRIEFMVSMNPGEPPMPLNKVASGGELSRLMLALKRLAPDVGQVPTVIFDEVDAGIGGTAATAVGRKLYSVSRSVQVLCVTHLPQVAAFAEHHHRVAKFEQDGRTRAEMVKVDGEARIEEMARMLGGAKMTAQSLSHARELLEVSTGE